MSGFFVFHLPSTLFAYSSSAGNQQPSLPWAFHLCSAIVTGSFSVSQQFKEDLWVRAAIRAFMFLIWSGCNVCDRERDFMEKL